MRIIAGTYGGRKLTAPKDSTIRPTSDKIRGAIFNILNGYDIMEDARVLDLFCGTGALGLEALSRGTAHCTFVDKNRKSLDLAKQNAENLAATAQCDFILQDAARLKNIPPANLIFLDPPYNQNLIAPILTHLHTENLIGPGAILIAEESKRWQPNIPPPYEILDERPYGETKIIFLRYALGP